MVSYGLYRDSHLRHHRNDHLDRSAKIQLLLQRRAVARRYPPAAAAGRRAHYADRPGAPSAGWISPRPAGAVKVLASGEWRTGIWGVHLSLLAMLLNWLQAQGIGAAFYLLAISYPALALTK